MNEQNKHLIDCLLIGHNEMEFREYEASVREMGAASGAYRDLNMNFLRCNNELVHVPDMFNVFWQSESAGAAEFTPVKMSETFNAAVSYLASFLNRRGFSFDYVNSFQDRKEELVQKLTGSDVLTVAIVTTYYVSVLPILEIVRFVREHSPSTRIIIGGPYISTQFRTRDAVSLEYLLETTIDADVYVNSSQGEDTLTQVITALKENRSLDSIKNIYYKDGNRYRSTPVEKEDNRLEDNMVAWDLFYRNIGQYAAVRTSISCPFTCAFCGFPEHAGKYQTAGVDAVIDELDRLQQSGEVKSVHFIDDTFNVPHERYKELLRRMVEKKYTFKWHSYYRCQFAGQETVRLMKESGCEGVFLGIESGSDTILKNMNKATRSEDYYRGIKLLKEHGITTFGNFIIGFPGETRETINETIHFIETSGLDFFRVQLWYFEPITPIWKQREQYNIKGESFEWSHATMTSKEASDIVEEIFLTVKNAVWVPQYNFDFDTMWHLVHRGMDIPQLKAFLKAFSAGLKEKLQTGGTPEMSLDVLKQIKESCSSLETTPVPVEEALDTSEETGGLDADFDF